jgi:two-component system, sensor histidine kinase and response regulator
MGKSYKILVVDDQKDHLKTIVEMIEQRSDIWEVFQANNGELSCQLAEKEEPDLIIMDWEMPGLSGIEATRKLKKNEKTSGIPVIICTGFMTTSEHLEEAFRAGAIDFIRKPIDIIELHSRMQSMLLLSESYKDIAALNNSKNILLSILAHDLKNPIYTVKLLLDVMLQKDMDAQAQREMIRAVHSSLGSTFNLLENLLYWANSQRNKISFEPGMICIYDLVDENRKLLELNAENKHVSIIMDISKGILAYADKNMISTVIRNLISNAIKYSHKGGAVKISAKEGQSHVEISVEDNGMGISEGDMVKIFDHTIHYTTYGTENEKGSGIGLQLCQEFILKNGGRLEVESKENEGSTFHFDLPKSAR